MAAIVESHQRTVYNVALRMCGNPHDAEETLQETFLSAIQALPKFEGRSQLSTWLYRIASNACLMQRRRQASNPEPALLEEDAAGARGEFALPKYFVDWSDPPADRPDARLLDSELHSVMEEAIARLPDSLRIVFIWRDLEGLSTAETAEVLGLSEGAVKVRLHRARLQLRDLLSHYYAEPADPNQTGNQTGSLLGDAADDRT